MSVEQVQQDWEDALSDLMDRWAPIIGDQIDDLVAQVREIIESGDYSALAALTVDTADASDELLAAMEDLAAVAAEGMADEAAEQGVDTDPGEADSGSLGRIAAAMVGLLATGLAVAAGTEALRQSTPGRSPKDVADDVGTHLEGLSDDHLHTHLGGALSSAQTQGRVATMELAPPDRYRSNEVNDKSQCGPCGEVDGTEYATLEDALEDYGAGHYRFCEGRWRCRGVIEAVWDD